QNLETFFFLFSFLRGFNPNRTSVTELFLSAQAVRGDNITVKSYKVESRITSRFAHTTFKSSVVNSGSKPQSIGFNVHIPKRAFISNFTMNVNGITFVGSVKDKIVARNLYAQAKSRNKAAGIVRTNSQDMETFKTEVHVPPGSNIEFELHYQEMMQRKLGFYEHTLYLQPGRLVPKFQVDVYVYEPKGISSIQTKNTLGAHFADQIKVNSSTDKAHVVFEPSLQMQRKCETCTESAIDGVFTVIYDVNRGSNAGELQVSDGHFVHFFAPSKLPPLPKNIVFVIDVSGSMWGVKMKQTAEAMQAILDDLTIEDQFSIIDFNHNVRCWREDLVPASPIQTEDAKNYIQNIRPRGGTNINEALLRAVQMLVRASNHDLVEQRSVSMIIFVSDGDPTVGEIKLGTIQKNVKRVMREEFSLFSLGIGYDVDYDFLERISMENRGAFSREPEVHVYNVHEGLDPLKKEATMEVKGSRLLVTRYCPAHKTDRKHQQVVNSVRFALLRGWQKDYRRDTKQGTNVYCWFVHNSGKGFIDGHYTDYIVPGLNSFLHMNPGNTTQF
uniref:Inter-alpha-trypsin inhibitor heavy chain 2 n=1 Tax=Oryzias sinensis TaxID=183150 RepID=A0A8C7Z6L9_9TELE